MFIGRTVLDVNGERLGCVQEECAIRTSQHDDVGQEWLVVHGGMGVVPK